MSISITRWGLIALLFIFSTNILSAQEEKIEAAFTQKIIPKFSILSAFDPGEPAIQLGVEYIFKPYLSVQQQLGYVFYSPVSSIWGIRSRSEFKMYYNKDSRYAQSYISAEVLYKHLQNRGTRDFWREDFNYIQTIDIRAVRNTLGFMPKFGITNNYFTKKINIDFAFGIGAKVTYYNSNVPKDADQRFNNFFPDTYFNKGFIPDKYEVLPNILLSLQIGFVTDKK